MTLYKRLAEPRCFSFTTRKIHMSGNFAVFTADFKSCIAGEKYELCPTGFAFEVIFYW